MSCDLGEVTERLENEQSYWLVFDAKNSVRPTTTASMSSKFFPRKKWDVETDGNLKAQDQDCMLDVVAVRFLPIPEFVS